jgi:hypothetical protein
MTKPHLRLAGTTITAATLLLSVPALADSQPAAAIPIAVAAFDFVDTSGEATDQTAQHQARLQTFTQSVSSDLAKDGRYRVVAMTCGQAPCSAQRADPSELVESAQQAGAKFLMFGGIHKMSSLVLGAKIEILDVQASKLVFDRLLTFRGDTDDAWRRMEVFLMRDLQSQQF